MNVKRALCALIVVCLIFSVFTGRLVSMQIVSGGDYLNNLTDGYTTVTTTLAPRGEVYDRYGRPVIKNKTSYSVYLETVHMPAENRNSYILQIIELFWTRGLEFSDNLPISYFPYRFLSKAEVEDYDMSMFLEFLDYYGVVNNGSAPALIQKLSERFKLEGCTEKQQRAMISVLYEIYRKNTNSGIPLLFAKDVDAETVTILKENYIMYPGVSIEVETESEYVYPGVASHILGRVAAISSAEYEKLKDDGYTQHDMIGKDGIQKTMESYLRGTNGVTTRYYDKEGNLLRTEENIELKAGNTVVLTIDIELQAAVEKILAEKITALAEEQAILNARNSSRPQQTAQTGAIVVENVNTGEILAMASYPSYNLETYNEDFEDNNSNPLSPFLNRAIGSAYEAGSTFKMIAALMGLNEGVITAGTQYRCVGHYDFYDYHPSCYNKNVHGLNNLKSALRKSCNAFFFNIFDDPRCNLVTHNKYARLMGFGEKTGIELPNETAGFFLTSELRVERGMALGAELQVAIGQQTTVTPIQLAGYASMLATGSVRYKQHIVSEIIDYSYNGVIFDSEPEAVAYFSDLGISDSDIEEVRLDMKGVVDGGSGSKYLTKFNAAGKTGTAEVGDKTPNAVYVAFAPFNEPEIAVSIVIEHGEKGEHLAETAGLIMEQYFGSANENQTIDLVGSLLR